MKRKTLALIALALCAPAAAQTFDPAQAVSDSSLQAVAGREDLNQQARSNSVATVANNSVSGTSQTGAVAIDGQALQNLSGLAVINANTGNNVAINAAINVNIAITPRP